MIQYSKVTTGAKFNEEYSKLNDADRNTFSIVCSKLLNENFIYGQTDYDVDIYKAINRLREVVEYYFYLIDYELVHDDNYKIYFLKSKNERLRVKLRKLETVLLLVIAKLYSTNSLDLSFGSGVEVSVTLDSILNEINNTKIYRTKLYKTDVSNALKTLKRYKLIDLNSADINNVEVIKILPTILYVVKEANLTLIEDKLNNLSYEDSTLEGVITDETDED